VGRTAFFDQSACAGPTLCAAAMDGMGNVSLRTREKTNGHNNNNNNNNNNNLMIKRLNAMS
jgi:hypothetical protein